MVLTSDEIQSIQIDVTLRRPLRVKGNEADAFAKGLEQELLEARREGIVLDVSKELEVDGIKRV